jgi:hypothetical protein
MSERQDCANPDDLHAAGTGKAIAPEIRTRMPELATKGLAGYDFAVPFALQRMHY